MYSSRSCGSSLTGGLSERSILDDTGPGTGGWGLGTDDIWSALGPLNHTTKSTKSTKCVFVSLVGGRCVAGEIASRTSPGRLDPDPASETPSTAGPRRERVREV